MQQLTVKLRLRDKHAGERNRRARAVNFAWNYCNDAQKHAFQTRRAWRDKWLSYSALAAAPQALRMNSGCIPTRSKGFAGNTKNLESRKKSAGCDTVAASLSVGCRSTPGTALLTVRRSYSAACSTPRRVCGIPSNLASRSVLVASTKTLEDVGTSTCRSRLSVRTALRILVLGSTWGSIRWPD
jgi:hypothetical protein